MNKRLKDKKMMSGIITAGGFLIILAGSALSQQTALGQNYQGVYVDGTFVGYVAENVDVKDVILQARRKLAEESASRLCMDYEWSVKTEKKPFVRLEKKETLEEQLKKILAEKTIESRERAYTVAIGSYRGNFKTLDEVSDFLNQVRKNIQEACEVSGRDPKEVTLIAVSKTKPVPMLLEAYNAGARVFGENKVQEIVDKYPQLPEDIQWHMIGHLQRNKVKYIVDKVSMIHSVDSLRLAQTIEQEAAKHDVCVPILLEVNVAQEETKFGLKMEEVLPLVESIAEFPHIKIQGLMTIAPYVQNPEENRPVFRQLKKLSVDIAAKNINNVTMSVLSMGMTGDYQVAVQEGATMVRVGTGIFGERDYSKQAQDK